MSDQNKFPLPNWASSDESQRLYCGDSLDILKTLPDKSVQVICTSPGYFNLRDYGTGKWEGGDLNCNHKNLSRVQCGKADSHSPNQPARQGMLEPYRGVCGKCGATRVDKQIGLEDSPSEYISRLVEVFREARRVLRDDGICWIVIGDSYAANRSYQVASTKGGPKHSSAQAVSTNNKVPEGLKPKDLIGIPFLLAMALRDDGWYWRSIIPWICRNKLPQSVKDRPVADLEYVLMMTKTAKPYYDYAAVRVPAAQPSRKRSDRFGGVKHTGETTKHSDGGVFTGTVERSRRASDSFFDSLRSILDGGIGLLHNEDEEPLAIVANTQGTRLKHFATFPSRLLEPMILASTSEYGCCPKCGAPWTRILQKEKVMRERPNSLTKRSGEDGTGNFCPNDVAGVTFVTTGWSPTCDCTEMSPDFIGDDPAKMIVGTCNAPQPVPCTVCDIFFGSGTTGMVSRKLGRHFVGIELNQEYIEIARQRIEELR